MADVFISYARADVDRVRPLVAALEAEGYSVWWDPNVGGGDQWADLLESEITAAKAALVVWSADSKRSRWVREEAELAHHQDKLIPIFLDPGAIPFGFNTIHAEDFTDWSGARDGECWERLLLKLRSLAGIPETNVARPQPVTGPQIDAEAHGGASLTIALAMLFVGGFVGAVSSGSPVIGGGFAVAASFFLLFRTADTQLPGHLKALAGRWLLPASEGVRINVAEAFNTLFEAVFGRRHLSFTCLWRSALASTFFLVAFMGFALVFSQTVQTAFTDEWGSALRNIILTFIIANIVGDYLSLFQTRIFLRWTVRVPRLILPLVILDAVFTLAIYLGALYLVAVGFLLFSNLAGNGELRPLPDFFVYYQGLIPQLGAETANAALWARTWVLIFSVMTTYITSVWLWLVLITGPFVKPLVARGGGVTWLGRLLQVERVPFTVLGLLVALYMLVIAIPLSYIWPLIQAEFQVVGPTIDVIAQDIEDARAWEAASASDTIAAFEVYLQEHPDGQYTDLAQSRIETLKEIERAEAEAARQKEIEEQAQQAARDEAAWNAASSENTIGSYEAYLVTYPEGLYAASAKSAIDELLAKAAADEERRELEATRFKPGNVFADCKGCPEMVVIPAGEFLMGAPENENGRDADEEPQHAVKIPRPFAVGRYEVTWNEWEACAADGQCRKGKSDQGWGRARRPVIDVNWKFANGYVKWLTQKTGLRYRLLTEAEWEYVARAGTITPYSTGDNITTRQANFRGDNYLGQTVPVGSYPPNDFGVFDMHGNVNEWVEDCYHEDYSGAPKDGGPWTRDCELIPSITDRTDLRVLRGGSWQSESQRLRSASRGRGYSNLRFTGNDVGFRVARDLD